MQQIRQDKQYDLFWEKLLKFTDVMDISPPHLPRRKRRPARKMEVPVVTILGQQRIFIGNYTLKH